MGWNSYRKIKRYLDNCSPDSTPLTIKTMLLTEKGVIPVIVIFVYKAVQNKKRLSKKSTFCDDMLFTHRFQGNITS